MLTEVLVVGGLAVRRGRWYHMCGHEASCSMLSNARSGAAVTSASIIAGSSCKLNSTRLSFYLVNQSMQDTEKETLIGRFRSILLSLSLHDFEEVVGIFWISKTFKSLKDSKFSQRPNCRTFLLKS